MQYTKIFKFVKNEKFYLKIFDIFSYFCSKHKLWVHVRTASARYPQSMFWSKNNKYIGVPLLTPVLLYKSGVQGGIHFSWTCIPGAYFQTIEEKIATVVSLNMDKGLVATSLPTNEHMTAI